MFKLGLSTIIITMKKFATKLCSALDIRPHLVNNMLKPAVEYPLYSQVRMIKPIVSLKLINFNHDEMMKSLTDDDKQKITSASTNNEFYDFAKKYMANEIFSTSKAIHIKLNNRNIVGITKKAVLIEDEDPISFVDLAMHKKCVELVKLKYSMMLHSLIYTIIIAVILNWFLNTLDKTKISVEFRRVNKLDQVASSTKNIKYAIDQIEPIEPADLSKDTKDSSEAL